MRSRVIIWTSVQERKSKDIVKHKDIIRNVNVKIPDKDKRNELIFRELLFLVQTEQVTTYR